MLCTSSHEQAGARCALAGAEPSTLPGGGTAQAVGDRHEEDFMPTRGYEVDSGKARAREKTNKLREIELA